MKGLRNLTKGASKRKIVIMPGDIKYGFGAHLLLDFSGCLPEKLTDVAFIDDVLRTIPAKLGISKPGLVNVFKYRGQGAEAWGISGVVLAGESHLSIHTFPDKGRVYIGIFSGKGFDIDFAAETLSEIFHATGREVSLLDHGLTFPQPVELAGHGARELVGSHLTYQ